ncbi:MAG: AI-2E family transporter, partial [Ardenticatenales bacterium]|nr:AI-2E family transporter [Ardenticatenales bacterium]
MSWQLSMRQWLSLAFVAIFVLVVRILWPILTPLALALLLTYILIPLVDRVEQRTDWPRAGATAFVYLLLILLIALVPGIIVPLLVEQVQALIPTLLSAVDQIGGYVANLGTPIILGQRINPYDLYLQFSSGIVSMGTQLASSSVNIVFGFASTFVAGILWLLFMLVISFYIVKDSPNVSRYFWSLIPREMRPEVYYLTRRIDRTWHAFLRGQIVLSTVIFVVTTTVLMILGVPQAISLGLLAGALNILPSIGPVFSAVPAILLVLVQGSHRFDISPIVFALVVAVAYTLIQQLESNLLVPRIIGASVKLHPAMVILGALVGLSLVGFLGLFLAAPTLASLRVVTGYAYRKLLDPTFQPEGVVLPPEIVAIPDPRERPLVPLPESLMDDDWLNWRAWVHRFTRPRPTPPPPPEDSN